MYIICVFFLFYSCTLYLYHNRIDFRYRCLLYIIIYNNILIYMHEYIIQTLLPKLTYTNLSIICKINDLCLPIEIGRRSHNKLLYFLSFFTYNSLSVICVKPVTPFTILFLNKFCSN